MVPGVGVCGGIFKNSKANPFSVLMILFFLALLKKQLMLHVIWAIKPRYVYQLFIYKFILLLYSFVLEETWWLLKWDGANGVASACTFDWKEVKLVLKEPIKNWYFFFF